MARISLSREEYLESIRGSGEGAKSIVGGCSPEQLVWRPDGAWSIVECIDHLARTNAITLSAMQPAIAGALPGGAASLRTNGWLSTKFVRDTEPPPRTKFKAPAKMQP